MKINPVVAELLNADGQTDRRTGMTKLIVAFRNFAKAPKNSDKTVRSYCSGKFIRGRPNIFPSSNADQSTAARNIT
jgi:hypothetical protein